MKKSKRWLTPEEIEDLTYDLILFCMKWGMWYDGDAAIYCNGKRYCPNFDSEQAGNSFRELEGVQITTESLEDNMPEWVVREQEMSDLVGQKPDHILSMNIDGSLYHVLHDLEYIKKFSALTPEGQAEVLARTSLYYRVVVYKAPLQGLCYTVRDAVDWYAPPTTRWLKKGSNHSPLQFC